MSTVEEALKVREERKKRELQESKINTVDSALEVYKKRKQSNAQSSLPDLVSRINKEIEAAKNVSSPSWGKGSLGTFLESTRESRVNTSKLQREVESYKSYLDEKTYNSLYSAISELNKGYDSYVKNAEVMEHFDSQDSYNKWYEKYKKEEDEKQAVLGAEDFEEYSTLGAGVVNPEWNAAHAPLDIAGWKPFGDGETINNMVTFAEKNKAKAAGASGQALRGGGESTYGEIVSLINDHMKDDEKAIYNYYVGKGDTKKANEYLTYITDILRQRQAGLIVEQVDNTALEAVFSLGAGVQKGFTGLENFIKLAAGAVPVPTSTMQYAHGSMSQNNEGLWKVANDLAYTTGNMTPSILAGTIAGPAAGKAVGSIVTGISSAGNSYASMIEEGYGVDEARKYGVMVGIAEGGLSYAFSGISSIGGKGIDNIVSKVVDGIDNGIARFFAEVTLKMGSEALEEATQEVLDPVFKMIATGEDFEGIDWSNVAYSALLGGLSAGILEGVPRAASDINSNYQTNVQMGGLSNKGAVNAFFKGNENGTKGFKGVAEAYKLGKQNVNEIAGAYVNEALEIDPNNAFAQKMQTRLDKGKDASGYQINRLIESNENALVSQDKGKMKSAVESRLTELGETGDVSKLADVIVKAQTGEKLTSSERNILVNSKYGRRVSTELNPESIESGEYASKWAESIGTERINTEAYNRGIAKETIAESMKSNAVEGEISAPVGDANNATTTVAKAKMVDTEGNEVEVNPQRFATTDAGEMGVEIGGGNVVAASEVDFGDSDIGLIRQAAVDMSSRVGGFSVDTANVFVRGYDAASGQSAGAYIDGWITAYKFGAMKNPPPLSALAANPKTAQLSEEQRKNAYNFGRAFGNEKVVSTVSKNDAKISKSDSKMKKGRVIFDGAKYGKTLNERQRASLKALNFLSKALGKDIYVEKLKEGDSGWYDPATGDIHIDLNAGALGEKLLLFTSAHELTHDIRARLAEKFNILADAVFEEYTKKFGDHVMADLIDAKMEFLKEKGDITENMTEEEAYDLAYEEVICDCLETMLVDSDAIEALSKNIYAKDKTLWQRIKDFFARLVARIKAAYEGVDPDSEEGQRFRDLGEGAERIKKLWVEAIVELSEMESTTGEGNVKHSYSSIAYSFFGDKKVLVKDLENGSYKETEGYKKYVENCLNNMRQTVEGFSEKAALNEIEDSIDGIVRVAVAMKKAGYDILDNHAKRSAVDSKNRLLFSSLEPNSDYFTSSDISTICDKRINFAEIYDEIVRREEALGVPKGKRFFDNVDNYFILHKIMADKGLTQPCRQCYVESMRKNLAPMANAFLKLMQETDPDNKANDQLYQPSGKNKGELKSNNAKLRENLLETIVAEEYDITASDLTVEMLTTEDGLTQLKLQAPLIYEAFNSFYGQSKPKMPKSATPFRFGELTAMLTDNKGKIKKSLIDKIMSTGGFRLQSYSDFQIQNFADVLQVIFEAGTLGLSGHAYTKVPAFLDATKGTNLKRNISIFMYNDGGEWKIDRNDSFPYDLNKIYDIVKSDKQGNTSIIAVSQNEMMSAFIMANNNIGYFIPFHKSGMKMGTVRETIVKEGGREIKGYSGIKDHTRQQTEVWASANADHKAYTKVKKGINIYEFWDFDNVDNLSREGLIEKNVRAYIDACNEAGYLPKFREYVMNNSKVLNSVLNYSKQLGFVSQNATVDDISFEYKGYRIPYGYYKCLGDFGMFTPDGEASPIERLSLKDYNFDEAEAFFSDAETIRRNEILQQIANGEERERYRNSGMTTAEIAEEVQSKRNKVVEEVVSGEYKKVKHSHKADQKASYSDRDSLGNELSAEQQEFFKDSKVRDKKGNLMVLYHGTTANFNTFKKGDVGFHFGTKGAARGRVGFGKNVTLKEVYLNITNPIVFYEDLGSWDADFRLTRELYDKGILTQADAESVLFTDDRRYRRTTEAANKKLASVLLEKGYDGIAYSNTFETKKATTSYIVFNSNQAKEITNKTPTSNADIRYSHKADKKAAYSERISKENEFSENSIEKYSNQEYNIFGWARAIDAISFNELDDLYSKIKERTSLRDFKQSSKGEAIIEVNDKPHSTLDVDNVFVFVKGTRNNFAITRVVRFQAETETEMEILKEDIYEGRTCSDTHIAFYQEEGIAREYRREDFPTFAEYREGRSNGEESRGVNQNYRRSSKYGSGYSLSTSEDGEITESNILHQHRNSNGMKPRTLLANALETAVLEDEKNLLQTYKENIDKLYSEQEKLETVMSEIDEIRYKKSLSILGEEMSVKTFESRAKAKAKKLGINAEDVQFKLDRSNKKYTAYAVGHGTILEADKTFRSAEDNAKLNALWDEAKDISNQINTYDRELLRLQAMKPIKDVLRREKAMAVKKAEEKAEVRRKESVERVKESAAKTQRELMDRYQESRKKATEGRNKTAMRHKIKGIVSELNTLLLKPTAKKHIKEELRKEVADALSAINMDTVGADERVAMYNDLIAKEKNPDVIEELTKTRDRIQLQGDNLKEKLNNLQSAYEKIKNTDDIELNLAYQEVIQNSINAVSEKIGKTSIRNMTLEQLEDVYDLFSMIRKTVRDANKSFKEQKGQTIMQMAEAVNDQVRTVGGQPYKRNAIIAGLQRVGWTFLKPFVAFRTIGSDTLTNMYKELRNGEDTFYGDVSEAQAFIEEQKKKHGYKSWDTKKTKTFTAKSGKTFDLTLEQMMTLYAYYKREQAHDHIIEGGIVFEDSLITEKNKWGVPIKYEVTTKDAFNLSEETFREICDYLEKEHKDAAAFVNEMQAYLSDTMGAKGNEVSMELLGVKLFKEKFYLPIKSSQYYMNFKAEEAGEVKLKSPAFSKETVQHANNPIVIHNFTDLWAEHINDMSMYHSFVLALEDFTRVYNYKTKTDANVETMDTKATLETAYPGITKYINKFLKDMNGGVRGETVGWVEKLTSLSKKGAVLGSASVTIQQPSAVMRAMAYINPKYFVTSAHKSINLLKHKEDFAELKKYAPIAGIKEMGRFDIGMGQGTVDWIKSDKTVLDKAEDILSMPPAFMDEVTWVTIWNAVKRETVHNNPKLSASSEEFLRLAGERFTEVVSLSQVYDSVFSRSDIMRNKSWIAKAVTAFMAEPTTTLNMIWDSWVQAKRSGTVKGFVKATTTTGGAIVAAIVFNAALKSIITAMRDDDEDESYIEKYLEHLAGELKDDLNPLTLIPVAKDIVSIFQGYDVERMDMALFSDLQQAIDAMDSENKTVYEKWSGLVGAISAFFGVPAKNVERDIRGLITTIFGETEETTIEGMLNAIKEGWTGEEKSNGQQLYEAMLKGDKAQIKRIESRFEDQSKIETAIRKALRENDPRIKEAAEARYKGDISGYMKIVKSIIAEGHFKQDDIVAAINSEISAIKKGETPSGEETKEKDEVTSIYSGLDINSAFDNGDYAMAQEIIQDLIKTKVANGKTEKEAKSSLRSSMTSYWKPIYKKNPSRAEWSRIRKILYYSGLYGNLKDVDKTLEDWLKD